MVIVFLAFVLLSGHVGLLSTTYLKRDYVEVMSTVHEESRFPYVTICGLQPYSYREAKKFTANSTYNVHVRYVVYKVVWTSQ